MIELGWLEPGRIGTGNAVERSRGRRSGRTRTNRAPWRHRWFSNETSTSSSTTVVGATCTHSIAVLARCPNHLEEMTGGQGRPAFTAGVSVAAISVCAARGCGVVRPATRRRSGRPRMRASGVVERSQDPSDDGFSREPGPDLHPGPAAGPVRVIEAFGHHALHASAGVVEHPGPSDREVGGRRHRHETVRELPGEQVFEQGSASRIGRRADVGAVDGEQVEHDVRARRLDGQLVCSRGTRVEAPLQRGEVEPALGPEHQFPVYLRFWRKPRVELRVCVGDMSITRAG
jgi:hypothetical protein